MNHSSLTRHRHWPLYKKLRRSLARELQTNFREMGITVQVDEQTLDDHLHTTMPEIMASLTRLCRLDLEAREAQRAKNNRRRWSLLVLQPAAAPRESTTTS